MINFPSNPTPGVTTVTQGLKTWLCVGTDDSGQGIWDLTSTPEGAAAALLAQVQVVQQAAQDNQAGAEAARDAAAVSRDDAASLSIEAAASRDAANSSASDSAGYAGAAAEKALEASGSAGAASQSAASAASSALDAASAITEGMVPFQQVVTQMATNLISTQAVLAANYAFA